MSRIKSRGTGPELVLRRALRALGRRGYRVNFRPVPSSRRSADIVFIRARVAVMVDGCFWHACPEHYRPATNRREFWSAKIGANVARDRGTDLLFQAHGWLVVRVWEHEDAMQAANRIVEIVDGRKNGYGVGQG
ncbi:DNA mismatch endonuclease Vsr [Paenarthrobacter sp. YIM B13468]|uniref:DNA mismatch endonuclease Vsr n=1 Tax=Paenarthrobacter sp. YIM B13468 TaxID=3366295 RepID=UPI0036733AD9